MTLFRWRLPLVPLSRLSSPAFHCANTRHIFATRLTPTHQVQAFLDAHPRYIPDGWTDRSIPPPLVRSPVQESRVPVPPVLALQLWEARVFANVLGVVSLVSNLIVLWLFTFPLLFYIVRGIGLNACLLSQSRGAPWTSQHVYAATQL